MAAPSSTVPSPATGPGPTDADATFFTFVREVASGMATMLQEPSALATEAAGLVQEVPLVGIVCKTFLSLEQLVETAKSNKGDLAVLLELCYVVIEGLLDKRSDRSGLFKGFVVLDKCVARAKDVAKRCNGRVKPFILARKICREIASVRSDLLAFCSTNNLVLSNDTNARVEKLASDLVAKLEAMERPDVTQRYYEAMEEQVVLITREREDLRKKIEAEHRSSLNLEAELRGSKQALADMEAQLMANINNVSEKEEELMVAQKKLANMKKEVLLKTKALQDRDNGLDIIHKTSMDVEAALVDSKEALAAMKTELEEHRRATDFVSKAKLPPGAPRIRDWYTERKVIVSQACHRLGIGNSTGSGSEEPRMVGLAGPGGAGKSTAASMVVADVDVRASFHKGVLWLQVGQGATVRLPELMLRLAGMVYERVMSKACRPPRKAGLDKDPEDGAAYIQEVVDDSCRRFLVIADDVWDVEVLTELKRAGVWVLYTTRQDDLLPEPPLRLDEVLPEEAEMVLRRAADLDNDERLPDAAYELMRRCEFGVLHLAFVGRWGDVRGRKENRPWQRTLERIEEAQKGDKGGKPLSWRAAVLRAGLEELACDNPKHKELYLSLAILPKGLAFSSEVAAVLLYGDDFSGGDLDAASGVVATLERLSILTLRGGERYSVHDEHADFIQGCFEASRGTRDSVLRWWRGYLSSVRALVAFSSDWLVKSWDVLAHCEDKETPSRPYDVALGAMDSSNAELSTALEKVAEFQWLREDWSGAYSKYSQLLEIEEELLGVDHLDVALTLFTLGACAFRAGRMEEAEELCRRALAIREVKLGIGHPEVVSTLRELGVCLTNAGRRKEAEELLRQALAMQEGKLGFDHPDVAHTLHEFGVCLASEGRTKEAEECLRRALAIREEKLGADHPDVARTVQDLGVCLANAGRMKEAEDFLRRALAIRGDKLAVNHPDVASTLHSLGVCLSGSGRREEAEEFLQRALEIREKLGDDYLDVARTLHELGVCALTTETPAVAEKLYRRALAIREETLGVDHQDVARTLHELGVCLCNAGRRTEAEELYRRALAIRDEKVGVDPRDVANTLHGLGVCAGTAGRTNEAEELYRRALAIREETLGVDHLDVASTLYSLGVCLFNAGRMKEAEELHRRALAIRGEKLGVDDPRVARTRKALELASNSLSTCTVS